MPLRSDMVTFAEVLQAKGYQTGYAGKWHLDGSGKPQWAPRRQFGFADNRFMFNRGHWKKFELLEGKPRVAARKKGQPSYGVDGADATSFATDWLTDRALEFVEKNASGPFCYHLSLPDPHGPNTVRPPYDTMYRDMVIRPPATFLNTVSNPKWAPTAGNNGPKQFRADMMAAYFGMVKCIDDNVQRLIDRLDELKLLDNTVIVFTSDHGDLCYEHGRLNKGIPYEASARIPMIIAAPDKVASGTVIDAALGTVDFAPTILPLLVGTAPEGTQGRDFGGLLGKDAAQTLETWKDVAILRNAGTKASWIAAVSDRYKLVLSTSDRPWLFDLEEDPDELFNQLDEPADGSRVRSIARSLASAIDDYQQQVGDKHLQSPQLGKQLAQLRN
jgi:arylsulfatase A-like enzyme